MISTLNRIASDSAVGVWVVPETVPGQLAYPAAEHKIAAFDVSYPAQVPEYTNSKEKAATRDVLDRCQGALPAGEWGFSTYCRPKGVATPPQESNLVTGLAGVETVGGANVTYSLALQKPSYSLWFLVDHTMIFCAGATVGTCELSLADCSLVYKWGGGFMIMGSTGTDPLDAAVASGVTVLPVTDSLKYSTGGVVLLADADGNIVDDNSGSGYTITDVDDTTYALTVTPAIVTGAAATGFVAPLDPGGSVGGNPLETRTAVVTLGGVDKSIVEFTWTVKDEPEYLEREKTPQGHPISYAETQREVGGDLRLVFRRDDAGAFRLANEGTEQPMVLTVGDLAGYTLVINMGRVKLDMPAIEEAEPIVETTTSFTALATTGEDSYTMVYQ